MKFDLIFPALPPALDGIGDYTAHLASELARTHDVRILTAQPDALDLTEAGVTVEQVFSTTQRASVHNLVAPVAVRRPDWVLLQYNPFSYGRWGLNLHLPGAIRRIRAASPSTKIAVTVHEPFVPVNSLRFLVMTTWQRLQLWRLGRLADVIFFAIEPWTKQFESWFPDTRIAHLQVSSNMPRIDGDRQAIRRTLGYTPDSLVVGLFGRGHPSRLLSFVRRAVRQLRTDGRDAHVLYVGPAVDTVGQALSGIPHICTGALPGAEVSRHFAAMDLYLAPFRNGVSARRGSFLAGLQHGVATVSTIGEQTDALFETHRGEAFLLAPDDDMEMFETHVLTLAKNDALRNRIAEGGQHLFEDMFAWPRVAERMLETLQSPSFVSSPSPLSVPVAQ